MTTSADLVTTLNRQRDELDVSTPEGHAGLLSNRTRTRHVFNYSKAAKAAISLVMPIRDESYASDMLPSYFAMNLPEGRLLQTIRSRLQRDVHIDQMALLALTGRNQIGRVTFGDSRAPDGSAAPIWELGEILESSSRKLFARLLASNYASGISGFQPKALVTASVGTPSVHFQTAPCPSVTKVLDLIVKSSDDDQPLLPQNEYLCMTAASAAGIRVPNVWLARDGGLLVIQRFDRDEQTRSPLGFEDMATLIKRPLQSRYAGSYESIAHVIGVLCGKFRAESLYRLFEYVTYCSLTRNGDAHLKNFGLVYSGPESEDISLAPLFDATTTSIADLASPPGTNASNDETLALTLNGSREFPSRKSLLKFGRTVCGVAHPERVIDRIAEAMMSTLSTHAHCVDERLLNAMRHHWEIGLTSMRKEQS